MEARHQETEAVGCVESVGWRRESRMLVLILNVEELFFFFFNLKERSNILLIFWLIPGDGEILNG